MRGVDLSPGKLLEVLVGAGRHLGGQCHVPRGRDEERGHLELAERLGQGQLLLPVQLAGAVPVEGAAQLGRVLAHVLLDVVVHLLVADEGRGAELGQVVEERTLVSAEAGLALGGGAAVERSEELADALRALQAGLNIGTGQDQLVLEVVETAAGNDVLEGVPIGLDGKERRADAEDGLDQVGVPHGSAPDNGTTPVVATEDDLALADDLPGELTDVVRDALKGEALQGVGAGGARVAGHVGSHDAVALVHQEGDLVAPSKGDVGPSVAEKDGVDGRTLGLTDDVSVLLAPDVGGFIPHTGVVGDQLAGRHDGQKTEQKPGVFSTAPRRN